MNFNFDFHDPTKVIFGKGRISELGENAKRYGKKALIVTTGPFFNEIGLMDKVKGILKESNIDSEVFMDVNPNPLSTQIDKGAEFGRKANCDMIIGFGGGSSIDAAKGIAIAIGHNKPIWNFCPGSQEVLDTPTSKTLPVITVSTTSGTGSHVTCFSVITNPENKEKPGLGSEFLFPRVAIVDPEIMLTMPSNITASTGFDVLAHAIEAYTSNEATPITDLYCQEAIRLVGLYLRKAFKDGNDLEARSAMALADTYAGYSITVAVITLCHSISHVVGGISETVHGETLAAMTPHTMRFSMLKAPQKFKNVGLLLNNRCIKKDNEDVNGKELEFSIVEVEKLIKEIGLNTPLSEQGVKESDLENIAKQTVGYMAIGVDLDLRKAEESEVLEILKKSF